MSIRKIDARNMNEGLRLVRETLGPDAMIMRSLKRNGRVELFVELPAPSAPPKQASVLDTAPADLPTQEGAGVEAEVVEEFKRARQRMLEALEHASVEQQVAAPAARQGLVDDAAELKEHLLDPLDFSSFDEILQSIKSDQPGHSGFDAMTDPSTGKVNIKALVERLQLAPALAARVASCRRIDELIDALAIQISVVDTPPPARVIKAFVGPAGSGKTTTLAKLATRHVMQYGPDAVAIIGCDRIRTGAQEQLGKVAALLSVPFIQVSAQVSLEDALRKVGHRQLVMIDMPGIGMRDPQLAAELNKLDECGYVVERYLTLQANLQLEVLQMAVAVYAGSRPPQLILTKLDECCNLGTVLNLLVETQLPLAYVADGPHVPEDIAVARALPLVQQALALLRGEFAKQPISDFTMKGGVEMVSAS